MTSATPLVCRCQRLRSVGLRVLQGERAHHTRRAQSHLSTPRRHYAVRLRHNPSFSATALFHSASVPSSPVTAPGSSTVQDAAAAPSVPAALSSSSAPSQSAASRVPSSPPIRPVSAVMTPAPPSESALSASASAPPSLHLLRIPNLELGEAQLSSWLVPPGAHFTTGTPLCELDSDLAVIDYRAQQAGWMAKHAVSQGEPVHVDQVIAVVCDNEEDVGRAQKEWSARLKRKEGEREARGESVQHGLTEEIAAMKE